MEEIGKYFSEYKQIIAFVTTNGEVSTKDIVDNNGKVIMADLEKFKDRQGYFFLKNQKSKSVFLPSRFNVITVECDNLVVYHIDPGMNFEDPIVKQTTLAVEFLQTELNKMAFNATKETCQKAQNDAKDLGATVKITSDTDLKQMKEMLFTDVNNCDLPTVLIKSKKDQTLSLTKLSSLRMGKCTIVLIAGGNIQQ